MHLIEALSVALGCFIVGTSTQRLPIAHTNLTSLGEALTDAEEYLLKFNETYNLPSLAFGMTVRGKAVIRKSWGRLDLENNVAAKLSAKYRLGKH